MGAFPKMVREIQSLKEQADDLSQMTVDYIRPDKKDEFRRRVRAITNFRETSFYIPAGHGKSAIETLSGKLYSVIKLGRMAGKPGFSNMIPAWGHLLERCEALGRKMEIFDFADEQSVKGHLWWMSQRGGAVEMETLMQLKTALPSRYNEVPVLIEFAIQRINERLRNKVNGLCDFFGLRQEDVLGPDLGRMSSLLSAEVARKIELLDSLKCTMESHRNDPRARNWRRDVRPMLMGEVPVTVRTTQNKQVRRLVGEFREIPQPPPVEKDLATEESSSDAAGIEAFAIARIKDYQNSQSFYVDDEYLLQAGVSSHLPEGYEGTGVTVSVDEKEVEFEIVVHAEDMHISPAYKCSFTFKRDEESPLAEFKLTPYDEGDKTIRVEFLYRRHWLTTIRFEVKVEKKAATAGIGA